MGTKCQECDGACCRYVALEIDKPETKNDFENIRWYVAHRATTVFIEKKRWYICFRTRCNYLTEGNRCAMYQKRPNVCRRHGTSECEFGSKTYDYDLEFSTVEDVEEYYEEVKRKRRAKRAKATRRT